MSDHKLREPTMYPNGGPDPFAPEPLNTGDEPLPVPPIGPAIGQEIEAMSTCYGVLAALPEAAQRRALQWLGGVLTSGRGAAQAPVRSPFDTNIRPFETH